MEVDASSESDYEPNYETSEDEESREIDYPDSEDVAWDDEDP